MDKVSAQYQAHVLQPTPAPAATAATPTAHQKQEQEQADFLGGLTAVQQLEMQQLLELTLSQTHEALSAEFDPHLANLKLQIQAPSNTDEVSSRK